MVSKWESVENHGVKVGVFHIFNTVFHNFLRKNRKGGVTMADFRGMYNHSLDSKSRMVVPAAFRDGLGQKFVIAKDLGEQECLVLYPREEWDKIKDEIEALPATKESQAYYRWVYSRLDDCSIDPQNRVIIKETFRKYIKATKNIVLLGSGKKIEIWEEEMWNKLHGDDAEENKKYDFSSMPVHY